MAGGEACVACGAPVEGTAYLRHRAVAIYRCPSCGSMTALPRPATSDQIAFHDSAQYFDHPYFEDRRISASAERRCELLLERLSKAVDPSTLRGERHLDIGCDTGALALTMARLAGTRPIGIDVAQRAIAKARGAGIEAHCCSIEHAPGDLVDLAVITAVDVLEHVVDPAGFLEQVQRRLRPGGVCYIETPNIASLVFLVGASLAKVTGGRPAWMFERLFPPEHIQYFSHDGLVRAASSAGLQVVSLDTRVLPGEDIAASAAVRLPMALLQLLDRLAGTEILHCMVARRH